MAKTCSMLHSRRARSKALTIPAPRSVAAASKDDYMSTPPYKRQARRYHRSHASEPVRHTGLPHSKRKGAHHLAFIVGAPRDVGFVFGKAAAVPWDEPYKIYEKIQPRLEQWLRENTPSPRDMVRDKYGHQYSPHRLRWGLIPEPRRKVKQHDVG